MDEGGETTNEEEAAAVAEALTVGEHPHKHCPTSTAHRWMSIILTTHGPHLPHLLPLPVPQDSILRALKPLRTWLEEADGVIPSFRDSRLTSHSHISTLRFSPISTPVLLPTSG